MPPPVIAWKPAAASPDLASARLRCHKPAACLRAAGWRCEPFDPARMDRLLLAVQLAMCFVLTHGTRVLKHGLRPYFERRDRRELSVFTLGLRYLAHALTHDRPLYPRLVFYFH